MCEWWDPSSQRCAFLEYLSLNFKHPEMCPYPFKLLPALNLPGLEHGEYHDGFCLVMRGEAQDMGGGSHLVGGKGRTLQKKKVKGFRFRAWVSGPQEIRVEAPLLSWSDRGNDDELIRELYSASHPRLMAAFDAGRNDYIKRMGVDMYESKLKVYVLRVVETDDLRIQLDGTVLGINNKKGKPIKTTRKQEPFYLAPVTLNLSSNISSVDTKLEDITIADPDSGMGMITAKLWEVAVVPRIVWHVANVATQAHRVGRMEEDIDDPDDEDDIVREMNKKLNVRLG
jgi:hypothetical protein